jgi:hypothetical protein
MKARLESLGLTAATPVVQHGPSSLLNLRYSGFWVDPGPDHGGAAAIGLRIFVTDQGLSGVVHPQGRARA